MVLLTFTVKGHRLAGEPQDLVQVVSPTGDVRSAVPLVDVADTDKTASSGKAKVRK